MARLPYLDAGDLPEQDRYLLERPINVFRVLANAPAALRGVWALNDWIRWQTALTPSLRELVILEVGVLAASPYEYSHHARLAEEFGVPEASIRSLAHGAEADGSRSVEEAAVLQATREITTQGGASEMAWARLVDLLGAAQALEVVMIASYYNMVVRLLGSLDVDIEDDYVAMLEKYPMRAPEATAQGGR